MLKSLKILIVDDEPEARELLGLMIRDREDLEIAGLAGSVDEAIGMLKEHKPDLTLLDIQMPEKDGFQFIEEMNKIGILSGIIFVTAFENYAIRAIRSAAFDYILKPVKLNELIDSIDRFKGKQADDRQREITELLSKLNNTKSSKVKLNTRTGYFLIDPGEVCFCKADGNYTQIRLISGNTEITALNLGGVERKFGNGDFFRISRSYLINLNFLKQVDRKSSTCNLECKEGLIKIKVPSQNIRLLEHYFG